MSEAPSSKKLFSRFINVFREQQSIPELIKLVSTSIGAGFGALALSIVLIVAQSYFVGLEIALSTTPLIHFVTVVLTGYLVRKYCLRELGYPNDVIPALVYSITMGVYFASGIGSLLFLVIGMVAFFTGQFSILLALLSIGLSFNAALIGFWLPWVSCISTNTKDRFEHRHKLLLQWVQLEGIIRKYSTRLPILNKVVSGSRLRLAAFVKNKMSDSTKSVEENAELETSYEM